eukprot:gene56420-77320_t
MSIDTAFTEAAEAIRAHGAMAPIDCAIVLGTGLGGLADQLEDAIRIPYAAIPGFPAGGVSGHARQLCIGRLEGRTVLIYQGRAHYYEGGDPAVMRVPLGISLTVHDNGNGGAGPVGSSTRHFRLTARASNAAPALSDNIRRFSEFLTLVGLAALAAGGVGVANAVSAFLDQKRQVIASFKSLGAPGHLIVMIYLIQILSIAAIAIAAGLAIGAFITPIA